MRAAIGPNWAKRFAPEPALALVIMVLATSAQWGVGWSEIPIDAMFCLAGAISGWWLMPAAAIVGGLLLFWTFVVPPVSGTAGLVVFIVVFSAVRQGHRRAALIAIVLTVLAIVPMAVHGNAQTPGEYLLIVVLWLVFLLAAWTSGRFWRWAHQTIERERQLADLQVSHLRQGLARDLHDTVAQTLSHASLRAYHAMDDSLPQRTKDHLAAISAECSAAATDLRDLLANLRSTDEDTGSRPGGDVAQTLKAQAERLRQEGFLVEVDRRSAPLSAARAQLLSMVVLEAVNNMVKHADPNVVCEITLVDQGGLVIGTFENGRATRNQGPAGLGLVGVRERLALLGGKAETLCTDDSFTLRVELPRGLPAPLDPEPKASQG